MYNNVEAEEVILGKILDDAEKYQDYTQALTETDFTNNLNRDIFKTIKDLHFKNKDIDIISVKDVLQDKYSDVIECLVGLTEKGIFQNTNTHFKIIKVHAIKRDILEQFKQVVKGLKEVTEIDDLVSIKNDVLQKITDLTVTVDEMKDSKVEAIDEIYKQVEDNINGIKTNLYQYLTGIRRFDGITGGFKSPQLIILGARPAVGKTALALQMAYHITLNDKKVLFISREMETSQLLQRLFSNIKEVNHNKFMTGGFEEEDLGSIYTFRDEIKFRKLMFDTSISTVQQIRTKLRKEKDIDMVVVDYLQLLKADGKKQSREQEVSSISRGLKELCLEFEIPILALSQLSRANTGKPTLRDLRESGSLEQDSDLVFFLHRDDREDTMAEWFDLEMIIAKNRSGSCGNFKVRFVPKYVKFTNLEGY